MIGILNQKMKKWADWVVTMVTWPTFQISGSPSISGPAEDTNLKFSTWVKDKRPDTKEKIQNQSKRGVA